MWWLNCGSILIVVSVNPSLPLIDSPCALTPTHTASQLSWDWEKWCFSLRGLAVSHQFAFALTAIPESNLSRDPNQSSSHLQVWKAEFDILPFQPHHNILNLECKHGETVFSPDLAFLNLVCECVIDTQMCLDGRGTFPIGAKCHGAWFWLHLYMQHFLICWQCQGLPHSVIA